MPAAARRRVAAARGAAPATAAALPRAVAGRGTPTVPTAVLRRAGKALDRHQRLRHDGLPHDGSSYDGLPQHHLLRRAYYAERIPSTHHRELLRIQRAPTAAAGRLPARPPRAPRSAWSRRGRGVGQYQRRHFERLLCGLRRWAPAPYAMNAIYATLPAGCASSTVGGTTYYLCGNDVVPAVLRRERRLLPRGARSLTDPRRVIRIRSTKSETILLLILRFDHSNRICFEFRFRISDVRHLQVDWLVTGLPASLRTPSATPTSAKLTCTHELVARCVALREPHPRPGAVHGSGAPAARGHCRPSRPREGLGPAAGVIRNWVLTTRSPAAAGRSRYSRGPRCWLGSRSLVRPASGTPSA